MVNGTVMVDELALGAVLVGTSFAAALAALLTLHLHVGRQNRRSERDLFDIPDEDTVFLFDDTELLDATDSARALLDSLPDDTGPWERLAAWLDQRFPGFRSAIGELAQRGRIELHAAAHVPALVLRAEWREGVARLVLHDPAAEGRLVAVDRLSHLAAEEELAALRRMLEHTPIPIWRETGQGTINWANPAYLRLASARDHAAGALTWPLPRIFPDSSESELATSQTQEDTASDGKETRADGVRVQIPGDDDTRWFDCVTYPTERDERLRYALPADAAVKAETALKDFIDTLTRTFANLPVGLAVFDRQRRLQLFNPALADLTTLAPEFLSARPSLEGFFDALRTRRMIPEPKDYRTWRDAFTMTERGAETGQFEETWTLAKGATYRVTARPHTDGAVAFLMEDITAEISLTRRFRAEIETGQAVLDSMSEAMAVFSPAGTLVMSNAAYAALWGEDPETQVSEVGIAASLELWKKNAHPSPMWSELFALMGAGGPRRDWQGSAQLRDGRHLSCRLTPLAGGATLIGFHHVSCPPGSVDADTLAEPESSLPQRAGSA